MKRIISKRLLKIQPYKPGKPIDEVKRELGLKSVVKLASNESPFGPSPKVIKALAQEARSINRYPDGGCFYLRRELARRLKVSPEQIIFGNGSDELIVLAVRAFVDKGDEVVVARPSFLIYEIAAKTAGAKVKSVPLKDFYYDLAGMHKMISRKTKIIFIGNPDNPGGTYVTAKELQAFLRRVRRDILVFIDEAYFEYVTARDYPNSLRLLKIYKNVIVTRTFSKMYGLAGLRIGYGLADKRIIDILNRLREPFNVNSLAQAAALACLNDRSFYRRIARTIEQERQFFYRQFSLLGFDFKKSVTNFILVDTKTNSSRISRQLMKKGVIVRDMGFWGLKTFIRVTIGQRAENKKCVKALTEVLS